MIKSAGAAGLSGSNERGKIVVDPILARGRHFVGMPLNQAPPRLKARLV
jgi:hypothetical protein